MINCPSVSQLRSQIEGLLSNPDSHPELATHVESCPACQSYVESLLQAERVACRPASGGRPTVRDGSPPGDGAAALPSLPGYKMLGVLGRGGMGVVYKARHLQLNRLVALKMIRSEAPSPEQRARLRVEAEALARLQHPNIVQIHEVAEYDGSPCLVLEYVEGGTLADRLGRTPLPPGQAASLLLTLTGAIGAAHSAGVVHRDLKPSNVLLMADGTPKVTDFGLAKKLDESAGPTISGQVMGTPEYMAPEQAAASTKEVGPLADVYALGAILYECLTGRPPFLAATPLQTLAQVLSEEPVALRSLNPTVPRDLEVICLKCLEKDVARRYASAGQLGDDVRNFLQGVPIRARPTGAVVRGVKWVRRNPAVAVLSAAVLLVFAVGAGAATWFGLDAMYQAGEVKKSLAREQENAAELARSVEREKKKTEIAEVATSEAKEKAHRAQVALHAVKMAGTLEAWGRGEIAEAEQTLGVVQPEFQQTWECRFLRGRCRQRSLTMMGHTEPVRAVAFSPDGTRVASASNDRTVRVWDSVTGEGLLTLTGHARAVTVVTFSPDGTHVASAGEDDTVRVWEARTGRLLLSLTGHSDNVNGLAYSPDGSRLASASGDRTVKVWDTRRGKELLTIQGHTGPVTSVAWHPAASLLVAGDADKTVRVWDPRSGALLHELRGHKDAVRAVAFSRAGHRIFSAGHQGDFSSRVWDVATGQALQHVSGIGGDICALAYSPDDLNFLTPDGAGFRVFDVSGGNELNAFKNHTAKVLALAYSPDGSRIASGGVDRTVRVCDTTVSQWSISILGHTKPVLAVALSPDGDTIVSAGLDNAVKLWDARTGQLRFALGSHADQVRAVAISPDGSRIASGAWDKALKVWDAASGRLRDSFAHPERINALAYSPDGSRLVAGGWHGMLRVSDSTTGEKVLTLSADSNTVNAVAYSPDGTRILSAGGDRDVKVWDAATGRKLLTLQGHGDTVSAVAFSPDGLLIASACADKLVRVWDAATGKKLYSLEGHTEIVYAVAFSPDGSRIASGSADRTIKLWDTRTGQELIALKGHTQGVCALKFSADGTRIASGGLEGAWHIWDAGDPTRSDTHVEAFLRGERIRSFHGLSAARAAVRAETFGAIFHLDRLMALWPEARPSLLQQRTHLLCSALGERLNYNFVRALGRQAVAHPASVPQMETLKMLVARHQHAALDRLHGALLLRTGNPRDAAVVLRAAIRNRTHDEPPTDELLLCHALIALKRHDEARRYLGTASAWMDRGTTPQRLASLLGALPAGPFACLGALPHAHDPRLVAHDPFTAHDLLTLRLYAERALAR